MGLTSGNHFITAVPVGTTARPCGHGMACDAEDGRGEDCCFHVDGVLVLTFSSGISILCASSLGDKEGEEEKV